MSCTSIGLIQAIDPKRPYEELTIKMDWYEQLAIQRRTEVQVSLNECFRPVRTPQSSGVQYRCTVAGYTSGLPFDRIRWPKSGTVQDGSVTWTAEPMSVASLRWPITLNEWVVPAGLIRGADATGDWITYQILIGGGVAGQTYDIIHRIQCPDGKFEQVVRMLVTDE